jgi:adenylosuccinate lyase
VFDPLLAISPIDGRYAAHTEALRPLCSEFALMKNRVLVEVRWLESLAAHPGIPELAPFNAEELAYLDTIISAFNIDDAKKIKAFEQTTQHDVKAVEYFLREKLQAHPRLKQHLSFIHFACTSEDINNLAYGLMHKAVKTQLLEPAIDTIAGQLREFAHHYADLPMLGHTHGQAATPTTVGKEFANTLYRVAQATETLKGLNSFGKMNGAVGNYNAHHAVYPEVDWLAHSQQFVEGLGLRFQAYTTQILPHDDIAHICQSLMRVNTVLIDLCRDIWSYISMDYFQQATVSTETGSSTMPHKVNPILFENAEGNFGLSNALLNHLAQTLPVSRLQRDLTDSTLMRNTGVAFAHSLVALQSLKRGLAKLSPNVERLAADLERHWEIITEAVQTLMRRYGMDDAYEQLKAFSRGKKITQAELTAFIQQTALPPAAKQRLLALTPSNYVGYAAQLARTI